MNPIAVSLRRAVALAVLGVAAAPALAGQSATAAKPAALSAAERATVDRVRAETIKDVTSALAAPAMEGRGTGTPGGERAAKYIADRFAAVGLKPLGDNGTYLQAVPFRSTELLPETAVTAGANTLVLAKDFVPAPPFPAANVDAAGGLVFVGYGVVSEELKRDDLAGLDLKGKIAVVLGGKPTGVDDAAWAKEANRPAVIMGLMTRGVSGVVLANADSPKFGFDKIADYLTRRGVALASTPAAPATVPPIVLVSASGAEKIFDGSGATYADLRAKAEAGEAVSRDLAKPGSIAVRLARAEVTGSNVAAVLEGSDPALKGEAVLFTAHYDAFGRGADGRIYAGAADNALGVGEMVAIAEAAAKSHARPRRSLIFLAVCGEEFGLLGAKHWADHPTWPLERVVADVNFDGIGTETYGPVKQIVAFGAEYSTLGGVVTDVAASTGTALVPDPLPDEQAFYRSDHYALVKKGVPAVMLLGGPAGETATWIGRARTWLDTDYHQSTDVVRPDWNWDGPRTIAEVGLLVALRVAAADVAPSWLPSSPFSRPKAAAAAAPAGR
jgi:hypothetical protein